jgi:23S rRNA (guanosine2251-2'-O)-methyltransferase
MARGRDPSPILLQIRAEAERRGVPVDFVGLSEIGAIAPHESAQGVAAEVRHHVVRDVEQLLDASGGRPAFLLIVDQVQDPHNLGALLRTANAAGVQGVILSDRHTAPLSGVVAKSSAGAASVTPVARVPNLVHAMDRLRRPGVWVIGLDASGQDSIYDVDMTVPLALAVGGEERGLRRLSRDHCDHLVHLPMFGAVESLNASVAGALAMYEVVRQRVAAGQL